MRARPVTTALAATLLVACLVALGAEAATPKSFHKTFLINCGAVTTTASKQLCPRPPATSPLGTIKVSGPVVTATYVPSNHCSTVVLYLYVDGKKAAHTGRIGNTGTGKVTFRVKSPATHRLSFVEKGFVGGCNSGELVSIAGTITVAYTH